MKNTKNTTLGRKATTGLEKNEGMYKPRRAKNQQGDGAEFAFNGQMGSGVNRSESTHRYSGNASKMSMRENYGLIEKNRKGTAEDSCHDRMEHVGPSATKDPERYAISTAAQGHPIESGYNKVPHVANPDKIYITKAEK